MSSNSNPEPTMAGLKGCLISVLWTGAPGSRSCSKVGAWKGLKTLLSPPDVAVSSNSECTQWDKTLYSGFHVTRGKDPAKLLGFSGLVLHTDKSNYTGLHNKNGVKHITKKLKPAYCHCRIETLHLQFSWLYFWSTLMFWNSGMESIKRSLSDI